MPIRLGPDMEEMYPPVRRAIEDAMWHVLRRVAHAVILSLLAFVGLLAAVAGILLGTTPGFVLAGVGTLAAGLSVVRLDRSFDLRGVLRGPRR